MKGVYTDGLGFQNHIIPWETNRAYSLCTNLIKSQNNIRMKNSGEEILRKLYDNKRLSYSYNLQLPILN